MKKFKSIEIFLNDLIERLDEIPYEYIRPEFSNELKKIVKSLERCKKEFYSNLFLILAFGPVKSGKSTLINILAREKEVSPTKFGIECTIRPSIIIKTKKKPCIKRYFSKGSNFSKEKEKENFNLVLDYIRGIASTEELREVINIEEHEFNLTKIQKYVAGESYDYSELSKEPLITVIEIEANKSRLIDDRTAIVDVPGLDGVKSNWRESAIHDWILTRSDFLLFVQSSMAALNIETINFLKEVYVNSKEPPMQLIQNIIEAKHWRGKKYLMNEAIKQKQIGEKQVANIIPNLKEHGFGGSEVNLGIAHDYIFQDIEFEENEVLKTSGFESLENNLIEMLDLRRNEIQYMNSLKNLKKTLINVLDTFEIFNTDINQKIENINTEIYKFDTVSHILRNKFCDINISRLYKSTYKVDIKNYIDDVVLTLQKKFRVLADDYFSNISCSEMKWKKIKIEIEKCIKECLVEFQKYEYNYKSDTAYEMVKDLNDFIYSQVKEAASDGDISLVDLIEKSRLDREINIEEYRLLIKTRDIGKIFINLSWPDEKNIMKVEKENSRKILLRVLKDIDVKKTYEKNKESLLSFVNTFLEREFKEELYKYIEREFSKSIQTFLKNVSQARVPFESKLESEKEQYNVVKGIMVHYKPILEEKLIEINESM